jgi:hypothetical protein
VNPERATPTTIVSRAEIARTPGADLSNSLSAITDFVPGAWVPGAPSWVADWGAAKFSEGRFV